MALASLDAVVDGDDDFPPTIGQVLLSHRKFRGLTRLGLARRTSLSAKLIEKIERNERPVSRDNLKILLEALGIYALVGEEYFDLAFQPDTVRERLLASADTVPEAHDLALLDALDCPAALMAPASSDLIATNASFDRALPGAMESTNLLKWLLFDSRARQVLPEPYWTQETHLLVGGLHCRWPTLVTRSRLNLLLDDLMESHEFARFWSTPISANKVLSPILGLRDLSTGETIEHFRGTSEPEFPYKRRWRLYTISPVRAPHQRYCTNRNTRRTTRIEA